jgi:hypothetical protein
MLDAIVAVVVVILLATGVLIMVGPSNAMRRIRSLRQPKGIAAMFQPGPVREVAPRAVNPKTQRVLLAAARLAQWLRTHGQEEAAKEVRTSAARIAGNEPAGLYALQTSLRRVRVVNVTDSAAQERLHALVSELQSAVQDRFEQLELLPFKRP